MKTYYEIKTISNSVLDVDSTGRRVKVALNKVEVKDSDNDVIEKSSFNKTIKERGPQGKNLIWHLTDHNASLKSAVGKFKEAGVENDYLYGVTDIPNTSWGNDVLEFYKSGHINQHSIGFKTIQEEKQKDSELGDYNLIKEVMLYEGSAVLWGANEHTPTLSVGKSMTKKEAIDEYAATMEELRKIHKMFKSGHFTDETFELIEIKISQLTNKLQQLFEKATQPDAKSVEPDEDELLDVLKTFNNNLNGKTDNGKNRITEAA